MVMKFIRSIVSLCLALMVLVSATSFSVSKHICMGKVHSVALLQKADGCGMMEADAMNTIPAGQTAIKWKKCCEDREITFFGNEYQYKVSDQADASPLTPAVISFPVLLSSITPGFAPFTSAYTHYRPPLLHKDVTVMIQSFLI